MASRLKLRILACSLAFVSSTAPGLVAVLGSPGCSRHDGDEPSLEAAPPDEPAWVPPGRALDSGSPVLPDASDAGFDASDGRAEREVASLLDAGRFCGSAELRDCPLQAWMKRNVDPPLEVQDIGALAVAFEQIAALAPDDSREDGGLVYQNWRSISLDGADAARHGNLEAAKAACRGCHTAYRARYHAALRARELPRLAGLLRSPDSR